MAFVRITAPVTYPVTLAEAKATCRVTASDEDAFINLLIGAATNHVEEYLGRAIMSQTWALYQDSFSASFLLSRGPVVSVATLQYYDTASVLQTVDAADYTLDKTGDPAWVVPVADFIWPDVADGVNNVILTYQAGYAVVPDAIKWAILLLISQWFDNRSNIIVGNTVNEMPGGVAALLCNHRAFWF